VSLDITTARIAPIESRTIGCQAEFEFVWKGFVRQTMLKDIPSLSGSGSHGERDGFSRLGNAGALLKFGVF
jgi:hypothetical protein